DLTSDDTNLYAATDMGIFIAPQKGSFLANFSNWVRHGQVENIEQDDCKNIVTFNNKIYALMNDTIYSWDGVAWSYEWGDSNWISQSMEVWDDKIVIPQQLDNNGEIMGGRIFLINSSSQLDSISDGSISRPLFAMGDDNGDLWIADRWRGMIRVSGNSFEHLFPAGPASSSVQTITTYDGKVYVAPGSISAWKYLFNSDGFFINDGGFWINHNGNTLPALDSVLDIITIVIDPSDDHVYLGSYGRGLVEFYDGNAVVHKQNSSIGETIGDNGSYRVSGLAFDKDNNLWVSNFGAQNTLALKKEDDTWTSFKVPFSITGNTAGPIIVDDYDQKWMILPKEHGIVVFDHGEDLDDLSDDSWVHLGLGDGNGNLPSNNVLSIAQDRNGEIWVGTDKGIAVFYCPGDVLTEFGCDADQIFVTVDGFDAFLLETEAVTSITIDGANRKWLGTSNGAWLMSPDGTTEILYFNVDNSPLLSDDILDISVNNVNGEVFFGTDKGIISYRGTSTEGGNTFGEVKVFPNPVRPEHQGYIAISGLVENAPVKITDIGGKLIYSTNALGGQVVWDGKNYNGDRARSGVYLVFSTSKDGLEKNVAKFVIIN
ncbi:MAG: hypothetical protein IH946_08540, partial [Bacteroidetes bacterium]|nr:hypothetical protein [Bacteroidota bacterium]